MTNKYRKIIVAILSIIFLVVTSYNIYRIYNNKSSKSDDNSNSIDNISSVNDDKDTEEENQLEQVWEEKYSGNQLANGAQPYSSLYGKNKKSGSAQIRIKAPIGDDVIVMVKNANEKVVRHAYIRNNNNYTFHLSPGEYQVYFIFGSDWCPEKEAPNGQKGYFLHSSTSKDYPQYIDAYQILEYTLQSMMNGNFQPQGADTEEAF